ncbi:MAG: hypothetical protein RSH79_08880, partial [Clostridiales bacterium]
KTVYGFKESVPVSGSIFLSFVQCVLAACAPVYANQIIKQVKNNDKAPPNVKNRWGFFAIKILA